MDLKHCLQAACLAHVPVRLVALAAIALVSIAPAAFAEGNDAWGDSSNGYGRYMRAMARRRPGMAGTRQPIPRTDTPQAMVPPEAALARPVLGARLSKSDAQPSSCIPR
jgi:hypothetical protein